MDTCLYTSSCTLKGEKDDLQIRARGQEFSKSESTLILMCGEFSINIWVVGADFSLSFREEGVTAIMTTKGPELSF